MEQSERWRPVRVAAALRRSFAKGYGRKELGRDVAAGAVVGVVAIPLSMALGIASGVAPQNGLYTAIVAGFVVALLGGSKTQVTGPTAAFVVILAPVVAQFGIGGLMLATAMAGVLLMGLGLAKMGRLIQFVPSPVTLGFTAGIAVVIATLQLEDFLGLTVEGEPESYGGRLAALFDALPGSSWLEAVVASTCLAGLIAWPRITRKVPGPLVILPAIAVAAYLLQLAFPELHVATIRDRFSFMADGVLQAGIPNLPPMLAWPWEQPGPDGQPVGLSWEVLRALSMPALAIAMLGAIESLLSAVVSDGMTQTQHDPDAELFAQGVGNLVSPFFGGIASTGALARTATNVRSGGRSPVAAMVHALVVLLSMVVLAPLLGFLPMASLAALLMMVAWNMSEAPHFVDALRRAPRSDAFVQIVCFLLTVWFDMVVAVTVGVTLAAVLFMRRMVDVSGFNPVPLDKLDREGVRVEGLIVYEVQGALFFGAAHKAVKTLSTVDRGVRVVVLDLDAVVALDSTALMNLEATFRHLKGRGVAVIVSGLREQPADALERRRWTFEPGVLERTDTVEEAIERALVLLPTSARDRRSALEV